jgi:hypothetical protein
MRIGRPPLAPCLLPTQCRHSHSSGVARAARVAGVRPEWPECRATAATPATPDTRDNSVLPFWSGRSGLRAPTACPLGGPCAAGGRLRTGRLIDDHIASIVSSTPFIGLPSRMLDLHAHIGPAGGHAKK